MDQKKNIRVLVVGCGNMGQSHARAYHRLAAFEICGLVSRGDSKLRLNQLLEANYPLYDDYEEALWAAKPDAVCISTYPDSHECYAVQAFEAGCHVFLEKPLADSEEGARRVLEASRRSGKKLVIGYILRFHPSWMRFIELSQALGKPLAMRMNLNQQSKGAHWRTHLNLMNSVSPIVDCGVHYIDVMCQMTGSKPISVSAIGVRLSEEVPANMYNYGQLQIRFEDGSVGWYEAAWGPMVSETAFFVKDVIGPKGALSIVSKNQQDAGSEQIELHTQTSLLKFHHAALDEAGAFKQADEYLPTEGEPAHQELCDREQLFFYRAICEDMDLSSSNRDALYSLLIALACDRSVREGEMVKLNL